MSPQQAVEGSEPNYVHTSSLLSLQLFWSAFACRLTMEITLSYASKQACVSRAGREVLCSITVLQYNREMNNEKHRDCPGSQWLWAGVATVRDRFIQMLTYFELSIVPARLNEGTGTRTNRCKDTHPVRYPPGTRYPVR